MNLYSKAQGAENYREKTTISLSPEGNGCRFFITAIIPGGKCICKFASLVLNFPLPPTQTQSYENASMQPPATAPPLTRQKVGKGRTVILPKRAMNSKTLYLWSSDSRLEASLRSIPPLKSLERETVTRAVGPSWASTLSSWLWISLTNFLVSVLALVLSSRQKTSPFCFNSVGC